MHSESEIEKKATHVIPLFANDGDVQIESNGSKLKGVDLSVCIGVVRPEFSHDGLREVVLRDTTVAAKEMHVTFRLLSTNGWNAHPNLASYSSLSVGML